MSADIYKNSGELLNWAQETALAPRGGLSTAFTENGRYYLPLRVWSL